MTSEAAGPQRSFSSRLIGALKLDASVYEEVEHDPGALPQAIAVVALAALAGGIGAVGAVGWGGLVTGVIGAAVAWVVWSGIVWIIGVKLFQYTSDFAELLRTLGFVAAPQTLYVLAILPLPMLRTVLGLVILGMTLVGFVRAVRQALDITTEKALFVALLSLGVHLLMLWILGMAMVARG